MKRYSAVLLDIRMPDMDGLVAIQRIRASHRDTLPIIAYTADILDGSELLGKMGPDGVISKPVDPGEFLDVLQSVLRRFE